jgi:uncharacterized membrane protein YbhN (UPF0104 family)
MLSEFTSLLAAAVTRFGRVDRDVLAVALAFQAGNLVFRATAWRNVLAAAYPEERVPLLGVGASYAAGMALNGFVPARAGEALKVALARTQIRDSSVVTIAATGAVMLILDAVLGALFLAVAWWCGVLPAAPHLGALDYLGAHPLAVAALALGLAVVVALVVRRVRSGARRFAGKLARGGAILRTPGAYLAKVVLPQLGAWACRVGVAFSLLLAFGLPATIPLALLVVVAGGASTLAPGTPGGAGTQQLLLVYALGTAASASAALSFSIGMQIGVTAVNTLIGIAAVMLLARTLHPLRAMRVGLRARA